MADFPPYLPDRIQQTETEWKWLLGKMAGSESILEIGSCLGHSLRGFAAHCLKGSKIRSIDLGMVGPDNYATRGYLGATIETLVNMGYDAKVLFADSHSKEAIEWARNEGPYDFIYIDGDHSYNGVLQDWHNYCDMADLIGFHDINHGLHGVRDLWKELKELGYRTEEKVTSHQGTGLVYLRHGTIDRPWPQAHSQQRFRREGP